MCTVWVGNWREGERRQEEGERNLNAAIKEEKRDQSRPVTRNSEPPQCISQKN